MFLSLEANIANFGPLFITFPGPLNASQEPFLGIGVLEVDD